MNTHAPTLPVLLLSATMLVAFSGCSDSSHQGAQRGSTAKTASSTNSPIEIQPGVSVGKVRTGMTMQQVVAELGEPDNRTGNVLNYVRSGFSVMPNRAGAARVVMCGDNEGIRGELVSAFKGHTPEGIGMNSTRAEVVRAYGAPAQIDRSRPDHEALLYPALGIAFTLQDDRVHHIRVNFRDPQ